MNAPRIYLETTIPSYLVARASRDPIIQGLQEATKRWWRREKEAGRWFVSAFVETEVARGDPDAARERMAAIAGLPRLVPGEEVLALDLAGFDFHNPYHFVVYFKLSGTP